MELDEHESRLVSTLRKRLEEAFGARLRDLRAFGSRARGDAHPGSDLDVFVLLDRTDRKTRKQVYALADEVNIEDGFSIVLSPLVMDEAEFAHLIARERRLALDILREGVGV